MSDEGWTKDDVTDLLSFGSTPDLDHARATIAEGLRELMDAALGSDQPETIARALATCRDFRQDAATIADDVEAHLLACMGDRTLEVVGLGEFKVRRRTTRKAWDHDALVRAVIHSVYDERPQDSPADAWEVVDAIRECIGMGAGKVGALRARGIDPDEYCQTDELGYTVEMPPRTHGADDLL